MNTLALVAFFAGETVEVADATIVALPGPAYVEGVNQALTGADHDRVVLADGEHSLGPGALDALQDALIASGRPWAAFVGTNTFMGHTAALRDTGGLSEDFKAFYWWTDFDVEWVQPGDGMVTETDSDARQVAKGEAYYVGLRDKTVLEDNGG